MLFPFALRTCEIPLFETPYIGLYKSWLGFVIEFEGGYTDLLTILGQKKRNNNTAFVRRGVPSFF